ncbi:hypothetical protein E2542_SST22192 [Spatholobus suberectus]|nr:hypothetical protein E2542_SST22192 [Spatholobus suberectus]
MFLVSYSFSCKSTGSFVLTPGYLMVTIHYMSSEKGVAIPQQYSLANSWRLIPVEAKRSPLKAYLDCGNTVLKKIYKSEQHTS